jgi:hypothetical protein
VTDKKDFYFFAPNGAELQGTSETVDGAASCVFEGDDRSYDHDGNGTKIFWDGMTTQTIDGVTLFTDADDGLDWLAHHLIPGDENGVGPDPLSEETLAIIKEELRIGYALEAAKKLQSAMDRIDQSNSVRVYVNAPGAVTELSRAYTAAKRRALTAIADELEARAA